VEPLLTTRGEGLATGNQQCFELGLSMEAWWCRDLSVCSFTGGRGLDCEARHSVQQAGDKVAGHPAGICVGLVGSFS